MLFPSAARPLPSLSVLVSPVAATSGGSLGEPGRVDVFRFSVSDSKLINLHFSI